MTDAVRTLFVTDDAALGDAVEARAEAERPDVELSYVVGVEQALAVLDAERIDCVAVDSAFAARVDGEPVAAIQYGSADVRVETVPGPDHSGLHSAGGQLRRTDPEQVGALVRRIADVATAEHPDYPPPETGDGTASNVEEDSAISETESNPASTAPVRALSDAVLVIDADSTVRFATPAVEDVFGYEPGELVGESLTTLMPDEFADRHREGLGRYLREGERHLDWSYVELPGEHRDGREIPLGVSFGEFESNGERLFTGIVRDVSEQKRREEELRARVAQRHALTTISEHALKDWPLDDLFEEAVELVADVLDHDYCKVLELRPREDDLLLRAGVGWREGLVGSATVGTERDSQAGYTLLTDDPVVVEDLETEDRFTGPDLLTSHDVTSGISVVVGTADEPWGVLGTHDTDRRSYADHDVQFVAGVARILASAIQRRDRDRQLERYEAMLNATNDGMYAVDSESRFLAVNDAYVDLTGYDREELLGEHSSTVVGDALYEGPDEVQEALESGQDVVTVELALPTADGGSVPVEARISRLPLGDGEYGRVGVVRDVSDRRRREEKLTSLHETMQSLAEAETPTDIAEVAVETAVETLGFPNAAVALYDDERNTLVSTAQQWDGDVDDVLLGAHAEDVAWRTFVASEARRYDDLAAELDVDSDVASALSISLGKYGVFVAASPDVDAFDETDASLADILCENVRSALGRAEREERLRDQHDALREKNRELERVDRLNRVIRDITMALTDATSKDEVMQAVCDRLTRTGPYRFAWFGEHDRTTDRVEPGAWVGVEEGYLDDVYVTTDSDEARGNGPAGRAIRTGETQVQNDLLADPPFEPWREQALERGYRSCASVPVGYGGTLRGVLNIYAETPGIFNEMERDVLTELGETIGYALNALEQRQALVSEQSVELDFRIRGTGSPVLEFVAETGAEFEFENAVQRADDRLHAFFTVRGASPDETLAFAGDVPWIADVRLVGERDGEHRYECTLTDESFLQSLVSRGVLPRSLTAADGEGRFVVRVPRTVDVRTVVNHFEDFYDEVELVARRERDEPVMACQEFESELRDRLTERQEEVLGMAYHGGFFEWPRESTAEEIADALDVSQPTVSRHVRAAERALFGILFND